MNLPFGKSSLFFALSGACVIIAFVSGAGHVPEKPVSVARLDVKHLPNAIQVHPRVISGGLPDGDAGFRELARLGVKTVISVDGLKPDVQSAKRHGLRYVHLPHGYDSVPETRIHELAKAIVELPGPVYIHCHHGKHRSPAAAVSACIAAGMIEHKSGGNILRFAGTSPRYRGLYKSVRNTRVVPKSKLSEMRVQFRETIPLPPIVEAMTQMETTLERIEKFSSNAWQIDAKNPDRTPAHEALMLKELLTEFGRAPDNRRKSKSFRGLVKESDEYASDLLTALRSSDSGRAMTLVRSIRKKCVECHQQFRD